ncbi:DUF2851 family protein [Prosthecobacter fluviatilis]|uniref:DUF2851 family protein n=1 Tax=Prosthecobacter fluviatilis TaxID=445931 RepID=A0ABW0KUN8_9BACT
MTPLPLADRYARFRDAVFSGVAEHLPGFAEPMTELQLQSLWFSGSFGSEFTTTDGRTVRIADFGEWNSGAGPDFSGCAIVIDGQTVRGDIELDSDARDWERHTHGANKHFNHVVLHLFLNAPEERFFTRTSEHHDVPQVLLQAAMLPEGITPRTRLASARMGRCALPLREMEASSVQSIIESAAQHRLDLKSRRLHRSVAAHGREQAVYQALAQTLGYRRNQQPFAILAQRLPLKKITRLDAAKREAWLFGVSGFLEGVRSEDTEPATRSYLRQLWSEWWKLRSGMGRWLDGHQLLRWQLSAIRPGNHPQRRLGALAALLRSWSAIITPLADATRWSQAAWRESLLSLSHEFWDTHYTLLAEASEKPLALIGETRVQEMLANVAYPLLVPERTRLWAEYLELPALLDNQKVRRAVLRLFGDAPRGRDFTKKLHHQQGLLQIYEDFCLEDDSACADCPFPERLKEWS